MGLLIVFLFIWTGRVVRSLAVKWLDYQAYSQLS